MNRIENLFQIKQSQGKAALILYLTAGFPDMETTEAIIPALEKAGADLIELGIPFSDPIADGPTIQKASTSSLKAGTTLRKIFALVKRLRKKTQIPLLLFSAYNPFYKYGLDGLVEKCARIGIDGLLVPDLPPEEAKRFITLCDKAGVSHVFLIAPTTPPDRARSIIEKSSGFIYYISTRGVTGARDQLDKSIGSHISHLHRLTDKPIAVGFGISRPEHVSLLKNKVEGIVVGSALIREIEKGKNIADRVKRASRYTRSLSLSL